MKKIIKLRADRHTFEIDGKLYVYEKDRTPRGTHSEELTLKLVEKDIYEKDIKETAKKLAKAIDNEQLIEDVLRSNPYEQVRKIKRLLNSGKKVKSKEGCFYLDIGDKEKLFIRP